jgi:hypothetical protein
MGEIQPDRVISLTRILAQEKDAHGLSCQKRPPLEFFPRTDDQFLLIRLNLRLHSESGVAERPGFVPARNPAFSGCEEHLERLQAAVVDRPGIAVIRGGPGSGKTALACEFANRFARYYEGVFWVYMGDRPLVEIAGEVAAQMRRAPEGDQDSVLFELNAIFEWRRYLLVLDHLQRKPRLLPGGKSSAVITTRHPRILPKAASVKLPPARAELQPSVFTAAMAACSPAGFPLSLAAEIAGVELDGVPAPAQPLDPEGYRCTVPQYVIDQTHITPELQLRHAQAVVRQPVTADILPDLYLAFRRLVHLPDHWDLACELARRIISFTQTERRLAEAFAVMEVLADEAEKRQDYRTLNRYARERVWTLHHWGREAEAKALERRSRRWQAVQLPLPWDEGWK